MNLPLDHQIDAAHHEAERIENEAHQIEARIVKAGGVPPVRRYGTPVSRAEVSRNLTLTGALQRRDPALAAYLGIGSDYHLKQQQAAEARRLQVESMQAKTEQLRKQNEAAADARYRAQMGPKIAGWR